MRFSEYGGSRRYSRAFVLRVIRAPADGVFQSDLDIGAQVVENQVIGHVSGEPVTAKLTGCLRGLIRSVSPVVRNLKIGDVDPRGNQTYCSTISEKARTISGQYWKRYSRRTTSRSISLNPQAAIPSLSAQLFQAGSFWFCLLNPQSIKVLTIQSLIFNLLNKIL